MSKGAYIAIEGISGSGKSTLVQMLARELQTADIPVLTIASTEKPSDLTAQTISRIIEDPRYPLTSQAEVLLYNAARAQSLDKIRASVEAGVTCIVDQSYLSVLVHEYYGRGTIADYTAADEIIRFATGALQPDLIIVLDTPVNTARSRMPKDRTSEFSEPQLERVRAGYLWEAKQRNIPVVYANDPVEAVFEHVKSYAQNSISALKPTQEVSSSKQPAKSVAEVLAKHPVSSKSSTPGDEPPLDNAPEHVAPADAARKPSYTLKQASTLLQTQFASMPGVSYTTSVNRRPDQKHKNGRYAYYVPDTLQGKLRSNYTRTLNQMLDIYGRLHTDLATYLRSNSTQSKGKQTSQDHDAIDMQAHNVLQVLLPLAVTTSIELNMSPHLIQETLTTLQSSALVEARGAAQHLLTQARTIDPTFSAQHVGESMRAAAGSRTKNRAAVAQLADQLLPNQHAIATQNIALVSYTPRNELDIVANIVYEQSDMPLHDLRRVTSSWTYEQKLRILKAYAGDADTPGDVFASVIYTFDLVSDYRTFHDWCLHTTQHHTKQMITPRMGYDTPDLVEQAGLSEAFTQCFDLSLLLHSELQAAGHTYEAQYAVLQGHKLRWTAECNAQELFRWANQKGLAPSGRELLSAMHASVAEVHPLIAETAQPSARKNSPHRNQATPK